MRNKIAIIFRGPIRPNAAMVTSNIKSLKKTFSNYEIETYLITWNTPDASIFIANGEVDNLIILKEFSKEFISTRLTTRTKQNSLFDRNYKAFWSVLNSIKIVLSTQKKYDWIVLTRTDLAIDLSNVNEWLDENLYTMPTQENFIINDQFGIAKPEIMHKAWDYIDLPTLNKLYAESFNPEDCLRRIMEMNQVISKKIEASHYELNPQRHTLDKAYLNSHMVRKGKLDNILKNNLSPKIYKSIKLIYKKWKK